MRIFTHYMVFDFCFFFFDALWVSLVIEFINVDISRLRGIYSTISVNLGKIFIYPKILKIF